MMTIDHLRVDHRITVLREFSDAAGARMSANESGVIRNMSWDQLKDEIHIEIERDQSGSAPAHHAASALVHLKFSLSAQSGPRNGHMREFFAVGDYAPVPGSEPVRRDPPKRAMLLPARDPARHDTAQTGGSSWWHEMRNTEGPDKQEGAEKALLAEIQHIGAASSIAEMYAQRMRAFQAEGNETRAMAAFKLATQWMSTYAGWATSGGEGAALSRERDEFHDALVKEFGYDPTLDDA